jgi:Kef-type K+ transport system membrane component KefB
VIDAFSTIGVLLLMFFAGLETDLHQLNKNRVAAVNVALGGLIVPFAGTLLFCHLFGMSWASALFLAMVFTATSVSISVQAYKELGQFKSRESMSVLGAALVDDLVVVIGLAVMLSVLTGGQLDLGMLLLKKTAFFAVAIAAAWKGIPWVMRRLAPLRIQEPVISAGVAIALLFAAFAEGLGVAGIIGAYIAGVGLARTPFAHEVERKLEPIAYAVFVPVFFVSIGLAVELKGLVHAPWFTIGLVVVAILTKWVGSGLGARLSGFNWRSSAGIGAGMVSRGEVALIIAALGLKQGLISHDHFAAAIVAIVIATMAAPVLIKQFVDKKE